MKMIEIYGIDGRVEHSANGDLIIATSQIQKDGKDCVQIEMMGDVLVHSYETLENFMKRTGEQWVELECGENPLKVKPSTIVGYRKDSKGVCFWISGNVDGFLCTETLESFEEKLGIKKEGAE